MLTGYEGNQMCPSVEPTSAILRLNELLMVCVECPELKVIAQIAKKSIMVDFKTRFSPQEILKLIDPSYTE